MENATSSLDEAVKSVWRVTLNLIELDLTLLQLLKGERLFYLESNKIANKRLSFTLDREKNPVASHAGTPSKVNYQKLLKFFGEDNFKDIPIKVGPYVYTVQRIYLHLLFTSHFKRTLIPWLI